MCAALSTFRCSSMTLVVVVGRMQRYSRYCSVIMVFYNECHVRQLRFNILFTAFNTRWFI